MNQQATNAPHRQPTRKQQHQPHKQPTQKAAVGGFDGLAIALLVINAALVAWAVLS
jgi:hypothetical protein